jgi:hypothetical protein
MLPTVLKRIEGFLRATRPNAYCVGCLAKSLGLTTLYDGDPETLARDAIASLPKLRFPSATRECWLCGGRKVTVWATAPNDDPR